MLFTQLFPLLASTGLVLDIKQTENDKIKLIIKFKVSDEKSEKINLNPLVLEGTAEEFDNGLIEELIDQMKVSVPSIMEQVNVLTTNLRKVLEDKTNLAKGKKAPAKAKPKAEVVKEVAKEEASLFTEPVKEEPKKVAKPKATPKPKAKPTPKPKPAPTPKVEEVVEEVVADDLNLSFEEPEETIDVVDVVELEAQDDSVQEEEDEDNPFA